MNQNEIIIFYCDLVIKTPQGYFCKGGLGCFLDEMARRYDKVFFCAPVKENKDTKKLYQIQSGNIIYQPLSDCSSFISALKKRRQILAELKKYSASWNAPVYMRWPSPFVYDVYKIGKKRNLPMELHVVGDTKVIINDSGKYKGPIKILAKLYINMLEKQIQKIMEAIPTLVNGSGLRRLYEGNSKAKVKEIRSATLSIRDFDDSCVPVADAGKLLTVGVLNSAKGINYLLDAVKLLKEASVPVSLTIVGDGPARESLEAQVQAEGLQKEVEFTGYVPLGPQLLKIYRKHGTFVLPSLSEGTPRVLIEAMANKLSVIATHTGGIPYTITDGENGIMVETKSAQQIAQAIQRLIDDPALRGRLIENGYAFAKENTIETFVDEICNVIVV